MYRYLERRLVEHLREFLRRTYELETVNIVVEQPPKIEFGDTRCRSLSNLPQAAQSAAQDCRGDRRGRWLDSRL